MSGSLVGAVTDSLCVRLAVHGTDLQFCGGISGSKDTSGGSYTSSESIGDLQRTGVANYEVFCQEVSKLSTVMTWATGKVAYRKTGQPTNGVADRVTSGASDRTTDGPIDKTTDETTKLGMPDRTTAGFKGKHGGGVA